MERMAGLIASHRIASCTEPMVLTGIVPKKSPVVGCFCLLPKIWNSGAFLLPAFEVQTIEFLFSVAIIQGTAEDGSYDGSGPKNHHVSVASRTDTRHTTSEGAPLEERRRAAPSREGRKGVYREGEDRRGAGGRLVDGGVGNQGRVCV